MMEERLQFHGDALPSVLRFSPKLQSFFHRARQSKKAQEPQ